MRKVLDKFPELIDEKRPESQGDPFVVALALQRSEKPKLLSGEEYVVVTQERSRRGRVRIPDACEHFRLKCVDLFGMFRMEGWRF